MIMVIGVFYISPPIIYTSLRNYSLRNARSCTIIPYFFLLKKARVFVYFVFLSYRIDHATERYCHSVSQDTDYYCVTFSRSGQTIPIPLLQTTFDGLYLNSRTFLFGKMMEWVGKLFFVVPYAA